MLFGVYECQGGKVDKIPYGEYSVGMAKSKKKGSKNPHAQALAKLAAKGRMEKLTPERRQEIARKAVQARWAKAKRAAPTERA